MSAAKAAGITDGSNPNAFCACVQAVAMVKRSLGDDRHK
jgi:hypothetical protein